MATTHQLRPAATLDGDRLLRFAASAFTVAVLLHNSDHVRRGADAVASDVFWVGSMAIALEVAVVVVAVRGHRFAPLLTAVTGWSLAAGYVLVHGLPGRSWLSDPLFSGGAEGISQAAALLEVAAALVLGAAGTVVLRERGGLASVADPRPVQPWSTVLAHPAVLAMALGNAAILVLSFVDR